jgi:hypothetical protein
MLLFPLLLACEPAPWTQELALAPVLEHFDADQSGGMDQAEWDANAYEAPSFETVDSDGDGKLGVAELHDILQLQDPLSFDNVAAKSAPDQGLQDEYFHQNWSVRVFRDALCFQAAEIRAVAPDYALPDSDELLRVAKGVQEENRLPTPDELPSELRSACRELFDATQRVGLVSPAWLGACAG